MTKLQVRDVLLLVIGVFLGVLLAIGNSYLKPGEKPKDLQYSFDSNSKIDGTLNDGFRYAVENITGYTKDAVLVDISVIYWKPPTLHADDEQKNAIWIALSGTTVLQLYKDTVEFRDKIVRYSPFRVLNVGVEIPRDTLYKLEAFEKEKGKALQAVGQAREDLKSSIEALKCEWEKAQQWQKMECRSGKSPR